MSHPRSPRPIGILAVDVGLEPQRPIIRGILPFKLYYFLIIFYLELLHNQHYTYLPVSFCRHTRTQTRIHPLTREYSYSIKLYVYLSKWQDSNLRSRGPKPRGIPTFPHLVILILCFGSTTFYELVTISSRSMRDSNPLRTA